MCEFPLTLPYSRPLAAGAVHAEMALILMMRARLDLLEDQQGQQ